MSRYLVVVDSEAKARSLRDQMGGDLEILVLAAPPVAVSFVGGAALQGRNPVFKFSGLPAGKEFLEKLCASHDRDFYLALTSDMQGGYFSWTISEYVKGHTQGMVVPRHLNLIGLNKEELAESFRLVEPLQAEEASAYFVRTLFDGCLKKHLQRLIGTRVGPGNLPLDLSSLTTLFLLADREMEIQTYASALKWQVRVELGDGKGAKLGARLEEVYSVSGDGFFKDAAAVRKVIELFKDQPFLVKKVERKEFEIRSPAPYRIGELLKDAYLIHRVSPQRVMEFLRQMFDGVEIEGRYLGLISSASAMSDASRDLIVARIRRQVSEEFGEEALTADQENGGDSCLGVIMPLRPEVRGDMLGADQDESFVKIYELIRCRAMAGQMEGALGETLKIDFTAGDQCLFTSSTRVITDEGFFVCYQDADCQELLAESILGEVVAGQEFKSIQIIPEQTSGFPPEYYNFDTLFADLADFSMRIDLANVVIVQQLMDAGYISIGARGEIHGQENVSKVVPVVNRALPTMVGINLSAYLEQTISEVMSGRKPLDFAMQQFDQTLFMQGKVLVKVAVPTQMPLGKRSTSSKIIKAAPKVVVEEERDGEAVVEEVAAENIVASETVDKFLAPEQEIAGVHVEVDEESPPALGVEVSEIAEDGLAQAFLAEDSEDDWSEEVKEIFAQPAPPEVEVAVESGSIVSEPGEVPGKSPDKDCPVCGKKLVLKNDKFGRFWSCSGFPVCRHTESYEKSAAAAMDCPICKIGRVVSKLTPTGKSFYVCPEQDCEFMAWSPPHKVSCQVCSSPFLVEKKSADGKIHLRCPRAGCNYMQPLPGESGNGELARDAPVRKKVMVRRVSKGGAVTGGKRRKVRVVRRK
ncbi:MAG: topoisomerase DNA-binding C4 zinc finger domain-containing protein [Proteobacteria bacterium]|nr:topoisomerase DNA-binding C4 zinc finger domain-containing protein [Pseudomonadota bacterium]MBU1717245.1 topoisomerase DNA-binding C4 zinc finger domain-containing protein [Pseudomonadota bacterium]